jgi:hypothetical protein
MTQSSFSSSRRPDPEWLVTWLSLVLVTLSYLSGVSRAQTAVVLAPVPQLQFLDQSGVPLAFGCVFTYQVNTTTPLSTYTDYTGTTLNQNPVILSSGGSANIWLQAGQAYTFRVKSAGGTNCASGSTLYTVNGIGGGSTVLTTLVTYSAAPTFQDAAQIQLFELTLTGNASAQPMTFVGVTPPGIIYFQITQDASGAHSFSWPSNVVGGCAIGQSADEVTTQEFVYDGTNATAVGPCVTGTGPAITAGSIIDSGLTASNPICTDANKQFTSSCSSVLGITVNGQVIAPGGSGNVNAGAAAHSVALNEGNGSAIAGLLLGANQIAIGVASADPAASTIPQTASNQALGYTNGGTLFVVPVNLQSNVDQQLSGDQTISANTPTTYLTKSVTMPASGCPCRAFVSYGAYLSTANAGVAVVWIDDGTSKYATSQVLVTGSASAYGTSASEFSPTTFANNAAITFNARIDCSNSGGCTVTKNNNDSADATQSSWLNIAVLPSN